MLASTPLLEQRAQVIHVATDRLTLIPLAGLGCARCAAGQGCGGALFGRSKAGAPIELMVSDSSEFSLVQVQVGDIVVLGLPATSLQKLVLWSYGIPLLLMVLAVLMAAWLQFPERVQAGLALLVLLASARWVGRHLEARSTLPFCRLLRRDSAIDSSCRPA